MSHVSKYKSNILNLEKFKNICKSKNFGFRLLQENEKVKMFSLLKDNFEAEFTLPDWRYPLAIDKNGNIHYDNFRSKSTSMETLGNLLQDYNHSILNDAIDHSEFDHVYSTIDSDGNIVFELINY